MVAIFLSQSVMGEMKRCRNALCKLIILEALVLKTEYVGKMLHHKNFTFAFV